MALHINERVTRIEMSGIRKLANMASQYSDVISLTLGQPDIPPAKHIGEAVAEAVANNRTSYTENQGIMALRQGASAFVADKYELTYSPQDEVIVTAGASQALFVALTTLLEAGDEVIVPSPTYPAYLEIIQLCGAVPVLVDTTATDFKVTPEQLRTHITPKTKCFILSYPSNPTGTVLSKDEVDALADVLKDQELYVISDEIYSELIYDGIRHESIANRPGMREKTVVINGLSKSHSMTGYRIGFIFGARELMREMLKVHQYNVSCASSISQYAALSAVTTGKDDARHMREAYQLRRNFVHRRLNEMGLTAKLPGGAFYIFPYIGSYANNAMDFCAKLLHEQQVAAVPGSAFSTYGEGYIRISYSTTMEKLETAMDKIETFIRTL
ncbi:aminotransferase class I/II-fold pyridoxal phosphate-dependent enzyme [Paenibacillus xanthanilyticus]|uniref:Aminotransferase n=1 Tax=Paenibacillus xanthanilyticus TaxID=1783531 RepID=A0ABV8K0E5_9BACL